MTTLERLVQSIILEHCPTGTRERDDVTLTLRSLRAVLHRTAVQAAFLERRACAHLASSFACDESNPDIIAQAILEQGEGNNE